MTTVVVIRSIAAKDAACSRSTAVSLCHAPKVEPAHPAPVDHYVLALTWSPAYCRFAPVGDDCEKRKQCDEHALGFVVHGLWAQAKNAQSVHDHPAYCKAAPIPFLSLLGKYICMTPSADLLVHEWLKHGTCIFDSAETYYQKSYALWSKLRMPALMKLTAAHQNVISARLLRRAFALANRHLNLKEEQVSIRTRRQQGIVYPVLDQLLICYDKNFELRACSHEPLPPQVYVQRR